VSRKTALIIGAGPAGLTAAYELLKRTDVTPIVLEKSTYMGGLSRTVRHRGNRIDIGGHRFFSKSDRVMQWWLEQLPMQIADNPDDAPPNDTPAEDTDRVMLVRQRRSRIYYERKFFDYPVSLSIDTLQKLGLWRVARIALSYLRSTLLPIRRAETLEHFFINRFGRELYRTFFESYTEKVWGRPCSEIPAEWGAQRIKGLSVGKAVWHAIKRPFTRGGVAQKGTETSLIEQFLYPKYGPGQMWEHVAEQVKRAGGQVLTNMEVRSLDVAGDRITAVEAVDVETGRPQTFRADYVFSTMPVKQLVGSLATDVPRPQREIAAGLVYRDFITVGLLLDDLKVKEQTEQGSRLIRDNWIYIQESDVQVGRMQIFNNWSPYLVRFDELRAWLDRFENLFLIGRNGMHRYNNMDHSMLTAMAAVDNVLSGRTGKSNIWAVNAEQEYHETRDDEPAETPEPAPEPTPEEEPVAS